MIVEKYVKIGERGQIVIPKEIREKENLQPEDRLKVMDLDGEIIIKVEKQKRQAELRALELLKKAKLTENDWQEIRQMRKE
jgi:AbrB family looped-hinge helix DNA binding protein